MATQYSIYEQELTAGGGTINLPSDANYDFYKFYGTRTLSSSWTIQSSGTLVKGVTYNIIYEANLTLGANSLTIFGLNIPQDLANRDFNAICVYNGSSWDVNLSVDFDGLPFITDSMLTSNSVTTIKIANDAVDADKLKDDIAIDLNRAVTTNHIRNSAVTTDKIANGAVTSAKLTISNKTELVVVPVSFETGEQCDNYVFIPYDCTLEEINYTVTKDITGTNNGTITILCNGVATTPASITIPQSSAINTNANVVISGSNRINAGQRISLVTSKTHPGGKLLLTLKLIRV